MRFVGLDVHKRGGQAHICDENGVAVKALRFDLSPDTLRQFCRDHLDEDCAVALEATSNTWAIVDVLHEHCPNVVVGNPLRTRAIAWSKQKTDRIDAAVLAQLLRCHYLPTVWIPDGATREQRHLAARRSALVRQSVALKNRLHSVLHQHLRQAPCDPFSQRGRDWLKTQDLPLSARSEIETLWRLLEALGDEQSVLLGEVDRVAFASDEIKLLMTLPGIDAITAHAIMAAIGEISRFKTAQALAAYFGLVPSVRQSAEHAYHGRITKQGNSTVRWLLVQAAQHAAKHPGPLGHQFAKLARRKNRNVAVVAILAWHLLTKKTPYRYAVPATVETKLARLRVSQQGRRKSGTAKGQPRSEQYGSGRRTRQRKSLPDVLQAEALPTPAPAPAAEQRVIDALGLADFASQIYTEARVQSRARVGAGRSTPETTRGTQGLHA